jgi:hypothetical protein
VGQQRAGGRAGPQVILGIGGRATEVLRDLAAGLLGFSP